MPFVALRFDAPAAAADAWSEALLAAGAASVDAADAKAGTSGEIPRYGEPGDPGGEMWPVSALTALFAADADIEASIRHAAAAVGLAAPAYSLETVADLDWVRRTQSQFGPLFITDRLWVVPSWCEPVDPQAINLELDPGLAFGTGSHATTRLCLRWLAAHLRPGQSVLDYGCGSGILAIAAAKLGAGAVTGTDVDPAAIAASRANAGATVSSDGSRRPTRSVPARSTSSSPTSWPIRCRSSRRCWPRGCGRGARSCSPASSQRRLRRWPRPMRDGLNSAPGGGRRMGGTGGPARAWRD